jgi:hypothetical protein
LPVCGSVTFRLAGAAGAVLSVHVNRLAAPFALVPSTLVAVR